jgi:hypothetical protein
MKTNLAVVASVPTVAQGLQCSQKEVQQTSRKGLRILLPGLQSVPFPSPPRAGLGQEEPQNRRSPVLHPPAKYLKTRLAALESHVEMIKGHGSKEARAELGKILASFRRKRHHIKMQHTEAELQSMRNMTPSAAWRAYDRKGNMRH